ncbi:MAG: formylglycine-generating enzyme family protein [Thiohalocapsa sp.]|uniref:formylglycine-generating enzyme family protein n=1 Tax=Thiohalocapsa sp. TaxID=2497641 RepID=UPI0025E2951A|nr:formylglycine-generating enzyme family protein [Thiohalocapsa sp.]MCG6941340.1 formylglycine-generating enzyme family protein [Thiohalocapsa sp.]
MLPADLLADLASGKLYVREGAVRELARRLDDPACDAATREAIRTVLAERQMQERDRFVYREIELALAARAAKPLTAFLDTLKDGGEGPEMLWLPPGRFLMGSPDSDGMAFEREKPQHEVRISSPFAIGRSPVTFDEYDRFCAATATDKPDDKGWGRGKRPVINVRWDDAIAYCQWLALQTGQPYRLPSEVEWEYACRAGTAASPPAAAPASCGPSGSAGILLAPGSAGILPARTWRNAARSRVSAA